MFPDSIRIWLAEHPTLSVVIEVLLVLLLAAVVYYITRRVILRGLAKLAARTSTTIDDLFFRDRVTKKVALIPPFLVLYAFARVVPEVSGAVQQVSVGVIILLLLLAIGGILASGADYYDRTKGTNARPIKGIVQTVVLILYLIAGIVFIGVITGESPWTLLSGIGALTAVILLIFRDTILNFVASINISSNDLVRVGDWIEAPNFNADGDVVDIALYSVRVQNFDKTVTVIPTYKLIDESFRNWRGMVESGGRRIKRAVYLDQTSIGFASDQMLDRFEQIPAITEYVRARRTEVATYNQERGLVGEERAFGRRMTNIGTFRRYVEAYLRAHPRINPDMVIIVRLLEPTSQGLPMEVICFTRATDAPTYEAIQSDIFDHVISVIPRFDLRLFQAPTWFDVRPVSPGTGGAVADL